MTRGGDARGIRGGFGGSAPEKKKKKKIVSFCVHLWAIFLFPVKELGLLTNPGH
jgi:hypothetical protein